MPTAGRPRSAPTVNSATANARFGALSTSQTPFTRLIPLLGLPRVSLIAAASPSDLPVKSKRFPSRPTVAPAANEEPRGSLNSGFGLGFARPNPHPVPVWPFRAGLAGRVSREFKGLSTFSYPEKPLCIFKNSCPALRGTPGAPMPASLLRHDRGGIALSSLLGLDAPGVPRLDAKWPNSS